MSTTRNSAKVAAKKRAVIIESQSLFVPFLVEILEASGLVVLGAYASPHPSALHKLQPEIVLIDVEHLDGPPLVWLRELRRRLAGAKLIVYAHRTDEAWSALARSLGADVVLGPTVGTRELHEVLIAA